MLNSINISHIFVFDQDKALDFYVGKLGLEVSNDLDLGVVAKSLAQGLLESVLQPPGVVRRVEPDVAALQDRLDVLEASLLERAAQLCHPDRPAADVHAAEQRDPVLHPMEASSTSPEG